MVGGALLATMLFIIVELRSKEPLIPLSLFRNRTFTLAVIASIATGIAMFGASVFLSQYMQLARGATPTEAGLMTIPMIAGLLISSIGVGALITRFGRWKPYLIVGSISLIAGSYLLSTIHYDTNFALVSLYMFLLGAGVGMTMQNLVLVVQNTSKPTEIGVASSGVTFFRSLGGTIGVSFMGAALAASVTDLMAGAKDQLTTAIMSLGAKGADIAAQIADRHAAAGLDDAARRPGDLRGHLRAGHLAVVPHRGAVRDHQPHRDHLPAEQPADAHDDQRAPSGERSGPRHGLGSRGHGCRRVGRRRVRRVDGVRRGNRVRCVD